MLVTRIAGSLLCVLVVGSPALAQNSAPPSPTRPRAVGPAKVEVEAEVGLYGLEHEAAGGGRYGPGGNVGVRYSPGGEALFGTQAAVGLTRHIALQVGGSVAHYQNDTWWQIAEPHNPYLADARLVSFWGGLRYEFGRQEQIARPYIGGGVISTAYTHVSRGPKDVCIAGFGCEAVAPELFEGTRVTGYVDMGVNFMLWRHWGFGAGVRAFWLRGDESDPNPNNWGTRGQDVFSYIHLHFGAIYRWR